MKYIQPVSPAWLKIKRQGYEKSRMAEPGSAARDELLALAARLVVAADALERHPYEIESLRQDCLAAAQVIRLMEEE